MSQTYNPSKVKRNRKHGFRARVATPGGASILRRRRRKNRKRLAVHAK